MALVVKAPGNVPFKIEKWKVKKGFMVTPSTVLALYKQGDSSKTEKFKCNHFGSVSKILKRAGEEISPGEEILHLEGCKHPTVMKDMCADCGADLRESRGLAGDRKSSTAASVAMVHSIPELIVSEEQALELGKEDEQRLLRHRKLVLLVDLDQTLLHTTNDNIPANLKDVYHFQLWHGRWTWYHTKFRPQTQTFLETISKDFELHICTFGVRMYAHTIAKFIDPDGKYFSHRILSRDECFSANSKTANLKALFPCGDSMVCIIDDREDVWKYAPNLIHVKPYLFFEGTADINSPPGVSNIPEDGAKPPRHNVKVTKVPRKKKDEVQKNDRSIDSGIGSEQQSANEKDSEDIECGDNIQQNFDTIENNADEPGDSIGQQNDNQQVPVSIDTENKPVQVISSSQSVSQEADSSSAGDKSKDNVVNVTSTSDQVDELKMELDISDSSDSDDDEKTADKSSDGQITSTSEEVKGISPDKNQVKNEIVSDSVAVGLHEVDQVQTSTELDKSLVVVNVSGADSTHQTQVESDPKNGSPTKVSSSSTEENIDDVSNKIKSTGVSKNDCTSPKDLDSAELSDQSKVVTTADSTVKANPCEEKMAVDETDTVMTEDSALKSKEVNNDSTTYQDSHNGDSAKNQPSEKDGKLEPPNQATDVPSEEYDEVVEWEDTDDYLIYLEDILKRIHTAFFEMYDQSKEKKTDHEIPDLKKIIPYVKKKVLKGTNILFSGVIPTNQPPEKSRAYIVAKSLGANVHNNFVPKEGSQEYTTHLVAAKLGTVKVNQVKKQKYVKVVNPDWLWTCAERWEWVDERLFTLTQESSYPYADSPDPNKMRSKALRSSKLSDPKQKGERSKGKGDAADNMFSDTINPLYSFSSSDIKDMDKEVDEIFDESESDDSEDELRRVVLGFGKKRDRESSSEADSLCAEYPKGWGNKRKKRTKLACKVDDTDNATEEEQEDESEISRKIVEDPLSVMNFSEKSSNSDSDFNESIGSLDDEMAEALEKEFLSD